MSNEDEFPEGPVPFFLRPPVLTPEQIAKRQAAIRKSQVTAENTCKAALPILKKIRERMHDLVGLGFGDNDRLTRAREQIALLNEDVEGLLHRPPVE